MSDQIKDQSVARQPWVAPEIQLLSVDDTHGTNGTGVDGGPYPESQS
jgi:hypothetical protein